MVPSFARQTITRLRPGEKTVRGSTVPDWSVVDAALIGGCSVQPGSTELSQDGRVLGVVDGLVCYCPPNADIREGDHIVYDGKTYTIDGMPKVWTGVFNTDHIQLTLRRWSG